MYITDIINILHMSKPVTHSDLIAISHINHLTNNIHSLTNDLYEDLMERDHETAKNKAKDIVVIMNDLIKSLSDEI